MIAGAGIAAAAVGVAIAWYRLFPPPAERVVDLYRTPTCSCAPAWIRALEADGFVVRTLSTETLRQTRRALNIPPVLQGCHVGIYLNYFLEGHVDTEGPRDLAIHRQAGKGPVTEAAPMAAQLQGATIDRKVLYC